MKLMQIFNQRKTHLFNGKEIREGDKVFFINSDRSNQECIVERRKYNYIHSETKEKLRKGTLFFCNATFQPCDYVNADKK